MNFIDVKDLSDTEKIDLRRRAKFLFWQGFSLAYIAQELGIKEPTIYSWKRRDAWDAVKPIDKVNDTLEARMTQLIIKEVKTAGDYKEIDLLGRQLERIARIHKYEGSGKEVDLNPKIANRYNQPKQPNKRNLLTPDQVTKLNELFFRKIYPHQQAWYEAGLKYRIRNILKSRQIGATNFFSYEALIDAINTGRNQIFLSASKAQSFMFRRYIVDFCHQIGVDLTGQEEIVFPHNDARLFFLSTNKSTAQGYHGNIYLDEYFWIHNFSEFKKVISGMASQKKWRQTYFSTPSSIQHPAYTFWTGSAFNKGKSKNEQVKIDVSHAHLKDGKLCADGQFRQIINIYDAEKAGFDLFDIAGLKNEYANDEFNNLFMCDFVDDTLSVFPLSELQKCMVDSWMQWEDLNPSSPQPLGDRSVWIGYDPSDIGDSAGLVVVSPPNISGGKFRVIEHHQFRGMDFSAQAFAIKQMCHKYHVTYIGIDATGLGIGVYQMVQKFFPAVQAFKYNIELKQQLIFKLQDVIRKRRLEYDSNARDLTSALMSIRKGLSAGGMRMTYHTARTDESSHGDLAWALMHAIANEPLASEGGASANEGFISFF